MEASSGVEPGRRGRKVAAIVFAATALFGLVGRLLGFGFGRHTVVRCREGHLFTTSWIPGVKLKAIDLGLARIQRCPVGRHWSLVVPVRRASLSAEQLAEAARHEDVRLP